MPELFNNPSKAVIHIFSGWNIFFNALAIVLAILAAGCSTTKFTEYHGSEVFQGKVGEVHSVDGIDIWENGEPQQKYKILGVIEETPKHRLPLERFSRILADSGDRESAIAGVARKQGGDAIILAAKPPGPSTDAEQSADGRHGSRQRFTLVVVKYVD